MTKKPKNLNILGTIYNFMNNNNIQSKGQGVI